jgi:hypothetical protein
MLAIYQALPSVNEFLDKLPSFDAEIEARRKEADAAGEVSFLSQYSQIHPPSVLSKSATLVSIDL